MQEQFSRGDSVVNIEDKKSYFCHRMSKLYNNGAVLVSCRLDSASIIRDKIHEFKPGKVLILEKINILHKAFRKRTFE